MKLSDFLEMTSGCPLDMELMCLDGSNGGGQLRTLNLTPSMVTITKEDAAESGDCEDLVGKTVLRIGYGCY